MTIDRKLSAALKGGFYYAAKFHPQGFLLTAGGDIGKGEVRLWQLDKDVSLADVSTPGPCVWRWTFIPTVSALP